MEKIEKDAEVNASDEKNIDNSELEKSQEKKNKIGKKEWLQVLKFVLFSISAGVIQFVSFTILNEWVIRDVGSKYGWSYFIALTLSVLWNFTFNRKFTFKSASNVPLAMSLVVFYYAIFTPLSIWWGVALERIGWNEYLILAMTMVINFVTEFIWDKFVVFNDKLLNKVFHKKQKNN